VKPGRRTSLPAVLAGLAALLLVAPPLGAIQVPQTRAEFVRAVAAGARGVKMETFVIERGFDEVYRTLEARDYNPTLKRLGPDRAEFSLQVIHRPRGVGATPPPGGLYIMAADLKRAGAARTEVVLYRPSMGLKDITSRATARS
jgi:hypothetical protein